MISALVAALQLAAADATVVRHGPEGAEFAAPQAVAHVAVFEERDERNRVRRIVRTRNGDWLREERSGGAGTVVTYSNLRTRIYIAISGEAQGLSNLQARVIGSTPRGGSYEGVATGEHEQILGERCDAWRWQDRVNDGPVYVVCETRDGVELARRVLYHDGLPIYSMRALSITRSHVPDASPPEDMLHWRAWAPAEGSGPNDEVVMDGGRTPDGRVIQMIVRRRAGVTWTSRSAFWGQQVEMSGGGMSLRYNDNAISTDLFLSRGARASRLFPEPASTGRRETVLGRTCVWFDILPGVSDAGQLQCRTEDGLVLKDEVTGRGLTSSFTATQVWIGGVTAEQVQPPEAIFTWLRSEPQH
jgi:hypothetical protein